MRTQQGIISMLTTIMISILLITMSLGLLLLTAGANQQASDDELSLRAYAGAESGAEWALAYLKKDPTATFTSGCNPTFGDPSFAALTNFMPPGPNSNAITCLTVAQTDNALSGVLDAKKAAQINVSPSFAANKPNIQSIEVSWLAPNLDVTLLKSSPYTKYDGPNLPQASGNAGLLPAIELTIVNYYALNGSNLNLIDNNGNKAIQVRNIVLFPSTNPSPLNTEPKNLANCTPSTSVTYQCVATVSPNNPPGDLNSSNQEGVIIYLRALYPGNSKFHYKVRLVLPGGGDLPVPLTEAKIDVTARSGPVYRRIIAFTRTTKPEIPAGLDYVLFGDQQICKDFNVHASSKDFPDPSGATIVSLCNGP
ncbi:MAG TPA: hypothetical protein VLE72_01295 [Candidatus Saccharimonadales bacterium]|nr:hypothetical protein [Candidatus Saccharimonadales bacterium]